MLDQSRAAGLIFAALGDGTRRGLVERLSRGPASVSELAEPLEMSLAAVVQHLQVLEECGLVASAKVGRVRTCQLAQGGLEPASKWIADRRALWEQRLDRLGELLAETPGTSASTSSPGARKARLRQRLTPRRQPTLTKKKRKS